MNEYKRNYIPFRIVDYKALEEWLNLQAEEGWQLEEITPLGFARFVQSGEMWSYSVVLWQIGIPDGRQDTDFRAFRAELEGFGWELVSENGPLHVFRALPDTPPLMTDPVAEAMHLRKRYWRSVIIAVIAAFALTLFLIYPVFTDGAATLYLAQPLTFAGLCSLLWIIVALCIRIVEYVRFRNTEKNVMELGAPLPAREWQQAARLSRFIRIASALSFSPIFAILVWAISEDAGVSYIIPYILGFVFLNLALRSGGTLHKAKRKKIRIGLAALAVLLIAVSSYAQVYSEQPIPESVEGLPVFYLDPDVPPLDAPYHTETPLMSFYRYIEGGSGLRMSACADCFSIGLARRTYYELAYEYRAIRLPTPVQPGYEPRFEAFSFPGVDEAMIARNEGVLVLRKGTRAVRFQCQPKARVDDPAYLQRIAEIFF